MSSYSFPVGMAQIQLEAAAPRAHDPEAVGSIAAVHELATKLEQEIDRKVVSGESGKRSITSETEVQSHITLPHERIKHGDSAKIDMKALTAELNRRYKAAGWKGVTVKKQEQGWDVVLYSALTDADRAEHTAVTRRVAAKGVSTCESGLRSVIDRYKAQLETDASACDHVRQPVKKGATAAKLMQRRQQRVPMNEGYEPNPTAKAVYTGSLRDGEAIASWAHLNDHLVLPVFIEEFTKWAKHTNYMNMTSDNLSFERKAREIWGSRNLGSWLNPHAGHSSFTSYAYRVLGYQWTDAAVYDPKNVRDGLDGYKGFEYKGVNTIGDDEWMITFVYDTGRQESDGSKIDALTKDFIQTAKARFHGVDVTAKRGEGRSRVDIIVARKQS